MKSPWFPRVSRMRHLYPRAKNDHLDNTAYNLHNLFEMLDTFKSLFGRTFLLMSVSLTPNKIDNARFSKRTIIGFVLMRCMRFVRFICGVLICWCEVSCHLVRFHARYAIRTFYMRGSYLLVRSLLCPSCVFLVYLIAPH